MKYLLLALALSLPCCPSAGLEAVNLTEAEARRARSVGQVAELGLPTNERLALLPAAAQLNVRPALAIADRAIAVMLSAIKGERGDDQSFRDSLTQFDERAAFTPNEITFIEAEAPQMQSRVNYSWRFECLHVLLWSLGAVSELSPPHVTADVGMSVSLVLDAGVAFGEGATVRPPEDLLDAADYYAQLLWAGRTLRASEVEIPETLNYSVAYERLRALRWLVDYHDQSWDDVTLETGG